MLVKGDKIRLIKPMGAFTSVGEICEVASVEPNGDIIFKFGFGGVHKGYMSANEFKRYFEKVEPEKAETNQMFAFEKGDLVQMTKTEKWLAPMEVGDEYVIQDMQYGVVVLYSDKNEKYYNVSQEILEKYFKKVEIKKAETNVAEGFDYLGNMIDNSQINITKVFDKCTIVACKLPNGFVIVESSACVDPDDYNEAIGVDNCLSRIKMRVAEMEAYVSHEEMTCGCDCECDCDCDDCLYNEDDEDEEDCTQNDLDCDDCPDRNHCDYYTNNN